MTSIVFYHFLRTFLENVCNSGICLKFLLLLFPSKLSHIFVQLRLDQNLKKISSEITTEFSKITTEISLKSCAGIPLKVVSEIS